MREPGERRDAARGGPERLVRFIERRGPLFVKMGQFLALRPDLLPQPYCDALLRLVDHAPTVPWAAVELILVEEFRAPVAAVFERIDPQPLASGSLAQVHVAQTHEGDEVVVKVQRPLLRAQVERDLRLARRVARLAQGLRLGPVIAPLDFVDEVEAWLRQELDFGRELDNQQRLHDALAGDPSVRVPRPFARLSTPRVVTSERLHGTPFSELVQRSDPGAQRGGAIVAAEREALGCNLLLTLFHQVFRLHRFHADPHPGNLLALPGSVVGIIDFGLVDTLTREVEEVQVRYLNALYNEDVPGMYSAIVRVLEPTPETDMEGFRRDFHEETQRWLARMNEEDSAPAQGRSATGSYMVVLIRLARLHRMRIPRSLMSLYRTLLTAETVAGQIGSSATLRSVGRQFFAGLPLERLLRELHPDRMLAMLLQLAEIAQRAPAQAHELLSDLAEGRFVLNVRSDDGERKRRAGVRRTRLLTLGIASTGLAVLLTGADRYPPLVAGLLWAAFIGIYVAMAVLWWRLD